MRISDWSSDVCSSDLLAAWPSRRLPVRPDAAQSHARSDSTLRPYLASHRERGADHHDAGNAQPPVGEDELLSGGALHAAYRGKAIGDRKSTRLNSSH